MEADAVKAGERVSKREAFFTATAREERLALKRAGDNVYATTVKEDAADAARERWGGEDREQGRESVLRARMARMTAEQADATGMSDTMRQRGRVKPALAKKMAATRQETLRVTQQLAGGLGASRSQALEEAVASAAPGGRSGGRQRKPEHWREESSAEGQESLDSTLARVEADEQSRVGAGLSERRGVLMATGGAAASWMALRR
jgi:hypothetical protein